MPSDPPVPTDTGETPERSWLRRLGIAFAGVWVGAPGLALDDGAPPDPAVALLALDRLSADPRAAPGRRHHRPAARSDAARAGSEGRGEGGHEGCRRGRGRRTRGDPGIVLDLEPFRAAAADGA